MKTSILKYLIVVLFLTSCENQIIEIKDYGTPKKRNEKVDVLLDLSEFRNYGIFTDRIREITCNDSVPKIVIKQENSLRNIYPIEHCEPIIFDPKGKHYVTFRDGKPYSQRTSVEILSDSLGEKLKNDFSYYFRNSNNSGEPNSYLVIIESKRTENLDGIEEFLIDLSQEYDNLKSDRVLNISFWDLFPYVPPPKKKSIN